MLHWPWPVPAADMATKSCVVESRDNVVSQGSRGCAGNLASLMIDGGNPQDGHGAAS